MGAVCDSLILNQGVGGPRRFPDGQNETAVKKQAWDPDAAGSLATEVMSDLCNSRRRGFQ